jgi:type IV secretory pathway VirB2 component (pilin)
MNISLEKKVIAAASLATTAMLVALPAFAALPNFPLGTDLETWLKNVLNILFGGIIVIAIIIIVLSGYDMIVAQGDPGKSGKAKEQIAWAIIGILTALVALALVNYVLLGGGATKVF